MDTKGRELAAETLTALVAQLVDVNPSNAKYSKIAIENSGPHVTKSVRVELPNGGFVDLFSFSRRE